MRYSSSHPTIPRALSHRLGGTTSLFVILAVLALCRASHGGEYAFTLFTPGSVQFPPNQPSADLSEVSFTPPSLEDSLVAIGFDEMTIVGAAWRSVPPGSGLMDFSNVYKLEGSSISSWQQAVERLQAVPGVARCAASAQCETFWTPNDPLYERQWHLENPPRQWTDSFNQPHWGLPDVDLDMAAVWDSTRGSNVAIHIIDTGIGGHDDLALADEIDVPAHCPGYLNDVPGHPHGTAVAGIAAARCNNSAGISGINCPPSPSSNVVSLRASSSSGSGVLELDAIVCGLEYAASHDGRVVNMSFGIKDTLNASDTFTLAAACKNAYLSGSFLIAAGGNQKCASALRHDCDNFSSIPANFDRTVFAVGAVTHGGKPWQKGIQQRYLDVAAPGGDQIQTLWFDADPEENGYVDIFTGTSAAAPMVSGIAALILGRHPSLTPRDLEYVLSRTAIDVAPAGRDSLTGHGMVSPHRALRFLSSPRTFLQDSIPPMSVDITDSTALYVKHFRNLGWWAGSGSVPDTPTAFLVRRYTLSGLANFSGGSLVDPRNVWVRPASGDAPGWIDADTLDCVQEVGWGAVDTSTCSSSTATLYSYTYALYDPADTSFVMFAPLNPGQCPSIPFSVVLGDFDDAPTVEVLSPNGGEQWLGSRTVRWSAADDSAIDSTSVLWSLDQGEDWPFLLHTGTEDSTWSWVIMGCDTLSQFSRIAVVAYDGDRDGAYDISDGDFTATCGDEVPIDPGTRLVPVSDVCGDRVRFAGEERAFVFEIGVRRRVLLQIYDVRGRMVRKLYDGVVERGLYNVPWDLRDGGGSVVADGVYFYRFRRDEHVTMGKVIVIKR